MCYRDLLLSKTKEKINDIINNNMSTIAYFEIKEYWNLTCREAKNKLCDEIIEMINGHKS